jgi:hypothetical protein
MAPSVIGCAPSTTLRAVSKSCRAFSSHAKAMRCKASFMEDMTVGDNFMDERDG